MRALHIFNPGNDMALASGQRFYTPRAAAMAMERAGMWLPLFLGENGDFIFIENGGEIPEEINNKWHHGLKIWRGEEVQSLRPWGWSPWIMERYARAFRKHKIKWDTSFERAVDLSRVTDLSHRRISIAVHKAMETNLVPIEAFSLSQVQEALNKWEKVVGKSPLSGSGRGIFHGSMLSADNFFRRCRDTISGQGSVMIERELNVIAEFAMLFRVSRENGISFLGYSLFETSADTYTSNLLLTDDDIRQRLSLICPTENLVSLEQRMESVMRCIIGHPEPYDGYFGVDMMIYEDNGITAVNPCVEVNMRTTMGVVAWHITHRFIHRDSCGHFGLCMASSENGSAKWIDGRLAEGRVSLSTPGDNLMFYVEAQKKTAPIFDIGAV